jgi:hypothetical protein
MKPIAQTFLVFQPNTGIDGVFLSKIDIFFKSVSSAYGITLQIRTVENGTPTSNVLAGGFSYLAPGSASASDDSTVASTFYFDTMPFLQTNTQYAIVLIPDGGNDQYLVWTALLGGTDVSTNAPIYTNNQLGNLFISSNDLVFTPVITESMKYKLYTADFFKGNTTISSATANVVYKMIPTDFVRISDSIGSFSVGEAVYASNTKVLNVTTSSNTLVLVPNSTIADFAVNNFIYVSKLDRSQFNLVRVVSAPNTTSIVVSSNISFTNASCVAGRVHGNGALYGACLSVTSYFSDDLTQLVLDSTLANTSLNFANSTNQFVFGSSSGASANVYSIYNRAYDSVTPIINYISPTQTNTSFSFSGYSNSIVQDSSAVGIIPNIPYEFIDQERLLLSRSNSLVNGSIGANDTLTVTATLATSNNLTAPYIDTLGTSVTITKNVLPSNAELTGYYLTIANTNGSFVSGELVTQGMATGIVNYANSSFIRINNINGVFASNNTTVVGATSTANATISAATLFNESLGNGYYAASRYICKNVVLAEGQDAEDLLLYMSAYRPVGSNFNVYGKFLNGSDSDAFSTKSWSQMVESPTSYALFSSSINRNDVVELQYDLPLSVMIDVSGAGTSSNTTVTVADSSKYSNGTFVYLADNSNAKFNVRQISGIANSSTLTLATNASFTSANVTVGYIPSILTQTDAFLYDRNNNISRYVNSTDIVFDTYKTFAVKVVPVSNNGITVPIMTNIRCVALQV